MPLSEHEQRLLDEIEQALYAEDPKFASAVRSARARSRASQLDAPVASLGVVARPRPGPGRPARHVIALSVVGFVLLVGACRLRRAVAAQPRQLEPAPTRRRRPRAAARPSGLRSRMEDRLRRRFDEN